MYFNEDDVIKINNILKGNDKFYAHLNDSNKETLEEHTNLCIKYFLKLVNEKEICTVFKTVENKLLCGFSYKGKEIFRKIMLNTIAFHDVGKINPIFQNTKMKNKISIGSEEFSKYSSKHSIFSSIIYIDYFIDEIIDLDEKEEKLLIYFLIYNSFIISRHHSALDSFNDYIKKFKKDEETYEIAEILEKYYQKVISKKFSLNNKKIKLINKAFNSEYLKSIKEDSIYIYSYSRILFSLLVTSDFYATSEFMNKTILDSFGEIDSIKDIYNIFNNTSVNKSIREYEKDKTLTKKGDINFLRSELFLETEKTLIKNIDANLFFLEAPTGSGKSNTAFNLSFKLIERNNTLKKIYYVYPFNSLVEQNINILNEIFEKNKSVLDKIAVINSIYPIKLDNKLLINDGEKDFSHEYYEKALLNKQFLNYPIVLTTHVSLFNIMFGNRKEDTFAFHQLANSVIVLDEIQSYKNMIWTEIITFLKSFSEILNIKVIIMSATLPNLDVISLNESNICKLINDRSIYFNDPIFQNRVIANYDLLEKHDVSDELYYHVINNTKLKKKILIEFIRKKSAYEFFYKLNKENINCKILLITGDDNIIERKRIINYISSKECNENGVVLVATQVIEAGIDIDMDIGYKDISKLDSEEQFMGRINRSCKREGIVYFFNLDKMNKIYKNDFRVNSELTLESDEMRNILKSKDFESYYIRVLNLIKEYNNALNDENIERFFYETVSKLDYCKIAERMQLINDDTWNMTVYLSRVIEEEGITLDGTEIWNEYKDILQNNNMNYAKKMINLSKIRSKLNYFTYEINKNIDLIYNDKIGDIYYIENGNEYFTNGKLDKEKFQNKVGVFIDL